MSYEILHFNNADKVIKEKKMANGVKQLMEYLHDCLFGTRHKDEIMRQALKEMDWRQNGDTKILEGRRYAYKGFKNRIAIDGSFSSYEYIQDALLKLQIGYDKKKIDMGIVMVTAQRSEKSKLGTTKQLVAKEIEMLRPTINLPVTIVLFDLGRPGELYEEKKQQKEEALPENADADPKLIDQYLHGNSAIKKSPDKKKKIVTKSKAKIHLVKNEPSQIAVNQ
jgi:hypothetical protein